MANLPWEVTEVVSGGAKGIDTLGEIWADVMGIPIVYFIPDWDKYGKRAGFMRNREMAEYAAEGPDGGGCVAFWNGFSAGTRNMIDTSKSLRLRVHIEMI